MSEVVVNFQYKTTGWSYLFALIVVLKIKWAIKYVIGKPFIKMQIDKQGWKPVILSPKEREEILKLIP